MTAPQYPVRSPLSIAPAGDRACRWSWDGGPEVLAEVIEYDGPRQDWIQALDLPYEAEALAALAEPRGFSTRGFHGVLLDESATLWPGRWRHRVREIDFEAAGPYLLTLSHFNPGVVIGQVGPLRVEPPGAVEGTEGWALVGEARLYESELVARVWPGIQRGLLRALCAVTLRRNAAPVGTGSLIEVALSDVATVVNAKITRLWTAP